MEQFNIEGFGGSELMSLLAPIIILIVGWILAFVGGKLTRAALRRTTVDDRLAAKIWGEERARKIDVEKTAGRVVFWVILAFTIVAVLQSLQLAAVAEPVNELLGTVFAYVPRILGAALLLVVAWLLAVVVRKVLATALTRWNVDRRIEPADEPPGATRRDTEPSPERPAGTEPVLATTETEPAPVARAISEAGYWLVFLLFVPAIVGVLNLEGLLAPVEEMIQEVLAFLPNLAAAVLIVAVAWIGGRLLRGLVTNVARGLGADRLPPRLGVPERALGKRSFSEILGFISLLAVVYFGVMEAVSVLGLDGVAELANELAAFGGRVLLALVIIAVGLFFANLAGRAVESTRVGQRRILSIVSRGAVLALAGAMALRQLGIANEIIELAFGLALGAIAVAAAIAFGFGGRDAAARTIEEVRERMRNQEGVFGRGRDAAE